MNTLFDFINEENDDDLSIQNDQQYSQRTLTMSSTLSKTTDSKIEEEYDSEYENSIKEIEKLRLTGSQNAHDKDKLFSLENKEKYWLNPSKISCFNNLFDIEQKIM